MTHTCIPPHWLLLMLPVSSLKLTFLEKAISDTLCRASSVLYIPRRTSAIKHLSQVYLAHFLRYFISSSFHLKFLWEGTSILTFAVIFVCRHLITIFLINPIFISNRQVYHLYFVHVPLFCVGDQSELVTGHCLQDRMLEWREC